ncbi:hypothetical protein LO763_20130 [Glycomyces sp. A-F 0318]|uniref:hypothetical protein n=1 Tax=Glycomyces amatae TaxID=2881355 RepID=UPI001E33992B|nr:hypothetical protein [Glycomyces amatae]MCD0445923.1 hypothetical protein [Glycomyces amatae]
MVGVNTAGTDAEPRPLVAVWLRRGWTWALIGVSSLAGAVAMLVVDTVAGAAVAGLHWCTTAGVAWFLHYPRGVYDPATGTYVLIWPFGLAWRRYPSRRGGGVLAVRGSRIVDTARPWRAIIYRSDLTDTHWECLVRHVRAHQERAVPGDTGPARPHFIRRRHRLTGLGLVLAAITCAVIAVMAMPAAADEIGLDTTNAGAIDQINAERAWVTVTMVDTGIVEYDHAFLTDKAILDGSSVMGEMDAHHDIDGHGPGVAAALHAAPLTIAFIAAAVALSSGAAAMGATRHHRARNRTPHP